MSKMFPPPKKYTPLSRKPTNIDRAELYKDLKEYGRFMGLCWLLSHHLFQPDFPFPQLRRSFFFEEFLKTRGLQEQLDCLVRCCRISSKDTVKISDLTGCQRHNPAWHLARKGRLTASNFGVVLKAKRVTPSLLKRLLGEYDLSSVKAVQWGVNNEEEAIKAFTSKTGKRVEDTGIWFHSSGILGASPDGIVDDQTVLEAKCPYTERNMTIEEAVQSSATFCLEKCESEQCYTLKKDHIYWHQVQGEMYFSQRKFCYFVVWTAKNSAVIRIERDETWAANIPLLTQFYFNPLTPDFFRIFLQF